MKAIHTLDLKKTLDKVQAITINQGLSEYKGQCFEALGVKNEEGAETAFVKMENEYRMYGELYGRAFIINLLKELDNNAIEISIDEEDNEESGE